MSQFLKPIRARRVLEQLIVAERASLEREEQAELLAS